MELIVKVNKLNDIYTLDNADAYLVANRHFSYRYDESFCINKIRTVKNYCKKNNKKIYVLLNKIFKDHFQLNNYFWNFKNDFSSIDCDVSHNIFDFTKEWNLSTFSI